MKRICVGDFVTCNGGSGYVTSVYADETVGCVYVVLAGDEYHRRMVDCIVEVMATEATTRRMFEELYHVASN